MRKQIPNLITSLNLLSGMGGIVLLMNGNMGGASMMIVVAGIFDFFDGLTARWLGVQSPGGRELDSLADVVSFGVLPGLILYKLYLFYSLEWSGLLWVVAGGLPLLFPVFSAWRLARFNIDTEQVANFKGLPTPAASLFVASLDAPGGFINTFQGIFIQPLFLVIISLLLGMLMVSRIPFFGLKLKKLSLKYYPMHLVFIVSGLGLLIGLGMAGLGIAMGMYIIINVGLWLAGHSLASA
ncbi:MAG: CDP-diacylglycerol--serine O-phosphatidyltransferase [Bacteroidales bacterium]